MKHFDLIHGLLNAAQDAEQQLNSALSIHGLAWSEYQVLLALRTAGDQKMRRVDLAKSVGLTPSGVTRLLAPMEKVGLVDRQKTERDARVSMVVLTKAGQRVFDEAQTSVEAASRSFTGRLRAELNDALSAIARFWGG